MFELTDVYYIYLILIILPSRCFPFKRYLRSSKLWSIKEYIYIYIYIHTYVYIYTYILYIYIYIYICLTKLLLTMTSIWLNNINSFWLLKKYTKTCFCMRKHIDISRTITIFRYLKTRDRKIRGNSNLLIKVKFHELEWSSTLIKTTFPNSFMNQSK